MEISIKCKRRRRRRNDYTTIALLFASIAALSMDTYIEPVRESERERAFGRELIAL